MSKKKKKASRKPAKKPPRMWLPADTFAAPPPFDDGLIDPDELGDLPIGTFPHSKTPLGNLAFGNLSLDDLSLDDLPPDERRIVEGMLGQFAAEMGFDGPPQNSALGKAQEMIYAAADERNPKQRIAKVKKALSICPDCADAYVMLAECATSEADAIDLYRQGVAAGERALGPQAFTEDVGHFWGLLETRPYMRARHGLANHLWTAGRHEEALTHYRELLRLNPGDNQGIRYVITPCLIEMGLDDELAALLKEYEGDDAADFVYAAAILAFRQEGDSPRARQALIAAAEQNPFVPEYMLELTRVAAEMPEYVGRGDRNEAMCFTVAQRRAWHSTPGAIAWMRQVLADRLAAPAEEPPARPPNPAAEKRRLLALPQHEDEMWLVDVLPIPRSSADAEETWLWMVLDPSQEVPVHFSLLDEPPDAADLWEELVDAMSSPFEDEAHRPAVVKVRHRQLEKAWRKKLRDIGVECQSTEFDDDFDIWDAIAESTAEMLAQRDRRAAAPPATVAELLELPQSAEDVWQLDVQRLPTWIHDGAQPWRPWIVFAVSATEKLIVAHDVRKEPVAADDVWRYLSGAITQPMMGEAHRPSVIEVSSAELLEGLRPRLAEINVRVALRDSLEEVDFAIRELAKTISADSIAALIDVPGVSLDMVGEFFSAAADYYRQMPWRKLPGDVPIQLTTPGFGGGVWYAVVMGQSGQTFGLAMYDDKKVLDDMLASDGSEQGEEENGRQMTGLSLMFGEAFEIAPRDLDAAERFGWPIAAPEAHPFAIWVNPGPNVRPPLAWELELITAALRAIPRFLADKPATPFAATVSLTSGERTVTLSWTE